MSVHYTLLQVIFVSTIEISALLPAGLRRVNAPAHTITTQHACTFRFRSSLQYNRKPIERRAMFWARGDNLEGCRKSSGIGCRARRKMKRSKAFALSPQKVLTRRHNRQVRFSGSRMDRDIRQVSIAPKAEEDGALSVTHLTISVLTYVPLPS